jgi:hypothetical protein
MIFMKTVWIRSAFVKGVLGAWVLLLSSLVGRSQATLTHIIAGDISYPGERDTFTFSLTSPKRFYFDSLTNVAALRWSLGRGSGILVANRSFGGTDGSYGDPLQLLPAGDYTLTIEAANGATNGYAFRFVDLSEATLITPGTVVTNGALPATSTDFYQFTAAAGDQFDFTRVASSGAINWRLLGPYGNYFFQQGFGTVGSVRLPDSGNYVLFVEGEIYNTATNLYSFRVDPAGNFPRVFTGTPLTFGTPYSGDLYPAGVTNAFTFAVAQPTWLILDVLTNKSGPYRQILGPGGTPVGYGSYFNNGSIGQNIFKAPAGNYQLLLNGPNGFTNGYQFQIVDAGAGQVIPVNTPVSGMLQPASSSAAYRVNLTAGQKIFFNAQSQSGFTYYGTSFVKLIDPNDTVLFDSSFSDQGPFAITVSGTYTLLVSGSDYETSAAGNFAFQIVSVTDGSQALALDTTVSGAITQPSQVQSYTFTLPTRTTISFDSIFYANNILWTLQGPTGVVANNVNMGSGGWLVYDLAPGDYSLAVKGSGVGTNGYAFRLLSLANSVPVAADATVNVSLTPASSSKVYRFAGTAGQSVYFNLFSQSGFNYYGTPFWTLLSPLGATLFDRGAGDYGPITLSDSGTYTLLVGGAVQETGAAGSASFIVSGVTNGLQSMTLGTEVIGAITEPGQVQSYSFSLAANATVSFDSVSNRNNVYWTLNGPSGVVANNVGMNSGGWFIYSLPAGNYTVAVTAAGGATNSFDFRLLRFADATPLSLDVPENGTLSPPTITTAYRFDAVSGQAVYFGANSQSGFTYYGVPFWTLVAPSGTQVFDRTFGDYGAVTLNETGTYTLLVGGYISEPSASGSFTFTVSGITNTAASFALGATVKDTITQPGQVRTYGFDVPVDTRILFDTLTNRSGFYWTLAGVAGTIVNNASFTSDGFFIYAVPAGHYTVTVSAQGGSSTGDFSFRILDFASGTSIPALATINGTNAPARSSSIYRFDASAGNRLFLDALGYSGYPYYGAPFWKLVSPNGNSLFETTLNDQGPFTLTESGSYTLVVGGNFNEPTAPGTYSFRYVVAPDSSQALPLGSLVSGSIDVPGQRQRYAFTLPSATKLAFDSWTNSPLRWSLTGPLGTVVNIRAFNGSDAQNFGGSNPVLSVPAGTYELSVTATGDTVGGYAFVLLDLGTAPPLSLNGTTSVALSPAWSSRAYRFNALAGDRVRTVGQTVSGAPSAIWRLIDPAGNQLWYAGFNGSTQSNLLANAGTYTLLIEGYLQDSVDGALNVTATSFPNIPPSPPSGTPVILGVAYTNTLATATATNSHLVHVTAQTSLYVDLLNVAYLNFSVLGTNGPVLTAQYTGGGAYDSRPWVDLAPGDYEIQFWGSATTYAVRFMDLRTAPVLPVDLAVTNQIVPASGSVLYRLVQPASTVLYYDGLLETGFNSGRQVRLYSQEDGLVWANGSPGGNYGPFTLAANRSYYFAIEGGWGNTSPAATVAFVMQTPVQSTNALVLGATVQGILDGGGDVDTFTFTLATAKSVFFDSLTNSYWTWTLTGPAGTYVNNRDGRFSDSADNDSRLVLPAGNYQLQIVSQSTDPTGYAFRLLDASTATSIAFGDTVSTNLIGGNSSALYTFNGAPGQNIYFRALASTGFNTPPFARLYNPAGTVIESFYLNNDRPTLTLPQSGPYLLSVEGRTYYNTSGTGYVSFAYQAVSYTTNALPIGASISGTLAGGGGIDYYAFNLSGTNRLFFDSLTNAYWTWTLTGPAGTYVNNRDARFSDSADVADSSLLLTPGTYLFQAISQSTSPTPYAFRFLDPAQAPLFSLGSTNSTNLIAGIGSGLFRFNASAGQRIYFDSVASTGFNNQPYSRLYNPLGTIIQSFYPNSDQDTITLPSTGTYTFSVEGRTYYNNSGTGYVSFAYAPVTYTTNALALDTLVMNQITQAGTRQFYTFTVAAPTQVFFDAITNGAARWNLQRSGTQIVSDRTFDNSDGAYYTESSLLLPAGSYVLTVNFNVGVTGAYAFRLVTTASVSAIAIDTAVTNTSSPSQLTRLFSMNGTAGQPLYFDGIGILSGGGGTPVAKLYAPDGTVLLNRPASSDQDTFILPFTGTYTVGLEGTFYSQVATQTTAFAFWSNPVKSPQPIFQTNSSPDLIVTGIGVAPASVLSGQGIIVGWTDQNSGGAATASSFTDRVTVRNTGTGQILVNSTLLYDASLGSNGPILPGGSRVRQLAVVLPDGAAAVGTLEATVNTDTANNIPEQNAGGTGEANNSASTTFTSTLAPYPDLRVASISVSPAAGWLPGGAINIAWAVTNTGSRFTSNSWSDRVILRNLTTAQTLFTSNVVYDATLPANGNLGPAGFRTNLLAVVLPNNGQAFGQFEISVEADVLNSVFELVPGIDAETNNLTAIQTLSAPDLVIAGLVVTPVPGPFSGARLDLSWQIQNNGTAIAQNGFYNRVRVVNTTTSQELVNVTPYYNAGTITNGTSASQTLSVNLPTGPQSAGALSITVSADTFNNLAEANGAGTAESNNSTGIPLNTTLDVYPDLLVSALSVQPVSLVSGANMMIRWTLTNSGTGPVVGNFYDRVTVVNTNLGLTLLSTYVYYSGAITNGTSLDRSYNFTLPNNTSGAGGLLVSVVADINNNVFEYNPGGTGEANNTNSIGAFSALTPLPELAVVSVTAPASARPGVPFPVVYALTNSGSAAAVGPWNDSILLSSDNVVGFDQLLVTRQTTNGVPAFSSLVVTQMVSFPANTPAGPVYLVVTADSGGALSETDESNNSLIDPDPVVVSGSLGLSLAVSQIAKSAPNPNVSATVTRNGNSIAALVVNLSSSAPAKASVPPSVTIPAGQASATFFVTAQQDTLFDGPQVAVITASATGYDPATNTLTVLDSNQRRVTITIAPTNVVEGASAIATITRDPATSTNLVVQLLSSDANQVSVPATVTFSGGMASTNVMITAVDDSQIERTNTYIITASATDFLPSSASLTVEDNDIPNVTLSLASHSISEGAGPNATSGTVTLPAPRPINIVILLQSSSPADAKVPASVTIPAGSISASFPVSAVDNSIVDGSRPVSIIGYVADSVYGQPLRATTPDVLLVTDDDGPTLKVFIADDLVPEGKNPATTGTVTRNTETSAALVVNLASDRTDKATVPATVTVPAGTNSATFPIVSLVNGITDGNQNVTVSATANGFTTGSATFVVSDVDLPDIVVSDIAVATNGYTGQNLTVTFTLGNNGLRGINTNITQRVFISTDALFGNDIIAAQPVYTGPLNVGDSIQQQATVKMPTTPGTYWIIVQADVFNTVAEALENNNTRVAATPVTIGPAYSATVATDVTVSRANMPVPLTGHAISAANGQPAGLVPVNVAVDVRGTRRVLAVVTDAAGNFQVNFNPLPNEAGTYRIVASHPGVSALPAWQDQFSILGFTVAPMSVADVMQGGSNTVFTTINNLSDQPLTGLVAEVYTNHASIHVDAAITNTTLAGNSQTALRFDIRAVDASAVQSSVGVRITSAEGVTNYFVFYVHQSLLMPALSAQPGSLQTSMLLAHQTPVSFTVTNGGGVATGPLEVLIPSLPWLALSSPGSLPPLAPGTNTTVTLLLTPPSDLPLGDYTGTVAINSTNAALSVQYRFRTISDQLGSLRVVAEDEYTYFTANSPRLSNALVRVTDALSGLPVATNSTAADGSTTFSNLVSAYYIVDVSADAHSSYRQSALVSPGDTTNIVAFLPRQTVSYTFTVVPTTVQDHYQFQVESTFETQVPIPVVTISPASVDLGQYPGTDFQIEYTIENHGLIAANNIRFVMPQATEFQIVPLITNIGTLGAQQSITIPATVHRGPPVGQNNLRQQTDYMSGVCSVTAQMLWNYLCGPNVVDKETASYAFDSTGCDLPALYNAVYMLVPDGSGAGSGGGGGPAPVIPADAGSNFAPPPGFKGICRPTPPANIIPPPGRPGVAQSSRDTVKQTADDNGVCARVKLSLNLNAVLTRDAFNATLELDNATASPLSQVLVTLQIQSSDSTNATTLFDIRSPQLLGLTGVDGNGGLSAFTTGSSSWILVPTLDAAPTNGARLFLVGGTMSYVQDGTQVTIPLTPAPIQVYPQPELIVRYFHDRDVFSDDPFTPQIEPSIPYSLAVQVANVGYGDAKNLTLSGGKPQIVDNQKGLLIDFQILGAQLENKPISPSLDVDLGSIAVNSNKIARWLFTSSLQGSFTNYSASFKYLDAVAGKRLSLVRSTEIHELTRIVNVDGPLTDGRPDLLVNDKADPQFLPDTLYLSQGTIVPVAAVTEAALANAISAGVLQTMITATMPTGWVYLRIGNPGGTNFVLKQVLRGDGSDLGVGTNAWTTDRFFFGGALRPINTNLLHLLDYNPGGTYTLVYSAGTNTADITPPTTVMRPLPTTSPIDFSLSWSATDDLSGVAFFDVYVSTNGGPFGLWSPRIAQPGAVFHGVPGQTYAFYALGTDAAGNAEAAPANPQVATAVTTVANQPPTLAPISDRSITEGGLFTFTPSAFDPDGLSQTLTFSLLSGTGNGALIDPATGTITWQTTVAHGGTTNFFALVVADNGMPSLSATQTFRVAVLEANSAPVVAPSRLLIVDEGTALGVLLTAIDSDLPAQSFTWQLLTGGPAGLVVDPTGLLTWTPTESDGPGTNYLKIRVTDSGVPALSATQAVTIVVNEVNLPPVVAPVAPKNANVGTQLSFTVVATDPDIPANRLAYSLGAGAPRVARIDPTNGVFTWTPTPEYASTTVSITVRVSDDGLPSLLATAAFEVRLGDFMGIEIGSAVVITNESGSLPIRLTGTARTTNATAIITLGAPVLASATVAAVPGVLQGATLKPLGGNRYALELVPVAGGIVGSTNPVAQFQFTTATTGSSAFVPVVVSAVTGTRNTGTSVDATGSANGRLVFINREPLLELLRDPSDAVTLYGRPGTGYELQHGTNLPGGDWRWIDRIPLTNRSTMVSVTVTNGIGFYRAQELGQPQPLLDLLGYGASSMSLMVYGEAGASYDIQTSPLLVGGTWTTRQTVALTVGYLEATLTNPGGAPFFVRAVKK